MRTVSLICTCAGLLALLLVLRTWAWWQQGGATAGAFILEVKEGASLSSVSRQLAARGALDHPWLWNAVARLGGRDADIKRGEFEMDRSMSPARLLDMLVAGRVRQYKVTLPEGITLAGALEILQGERVLEPVLDGSGDPRLLALVEDAVSAEGQFFPDTYTYRRGDTDLSVLTMAHRRMRQVLAQHWQGRADGLPYRDVRDALVMASIVEKETGHAEERGRIAGVFVRRLQRNMRLQTDPAVIYGLGGDFDGNLRRSHLRDADNPYNTYRHRGLPPTPISLPGQAAIEASLHPADGSELYFVARGDGSHAFSETLRQHREAVRQYQLNRKKRYRSSPEPVEEQP